MRKTCVKPVQDRLDTGPHSEPPTGIDPVTSFLPRTRSTTELGGQRVNTLPEVFALNKSRAKQGPLARKSPEIQAWSGLSAPLQRPSRAFGDADVTKRTHRRGGTTLNRNRPADQPACFYSDAEFTAAS